MSSDERVEAARGWAPRLIAHGVDPNDFARTLLRIRTWADWLPAWVVTAEGHEALAREAEAKGRRRTAGEAYVRAAVSYHFAKFAWLEDLDAVRVATDRSVATLRAGLRLLDPTFERLEIPFDRDRIVANLRRPPGLDRPAAVILVPGLDSTKEEFTRWEDVFLARGLATVSLDGPGQGEAGRVNPIRPDHEVAVAALLDVLERRADLDVGRIGIAGLGLGGYYAARAAAFEPRIAAAAMVGSPYAFTLRNASTARKFMHDAQLEDEEATRAYAARFTLEGVARRIVQPFLAVHGRRDAVMPWEGAARAAREAQRGELLLYEDGGTVCYTVDHRAKPDLADWMRERLEAGAAVRPSGERESAPRE